MIYPFIFQAACFILEKALKEIKYIPIFLHFYHLFLNKNRQDEIHF